MMRVACALLCLFALPASAQAQNAGVTSMPDNSPSGLTSSAPGNASEEAEIIGISPDASLADAAGGGFAPPDISLTEPISRTRLPTPIDKVDVDRRIDKGLTAAGETSAFPPDFAYGAFQRGFFLTAFSLALDRAKTGDAVAQTLLGELLSRGLGVKQDLSAAAGWYELAAVRGDAEALYALGRFHLEGQGVAQDFVKAAGFFEQAARKGHAVAARELAYMLLQGQGRDKDAMLAAAFMRRAASRGDMDAQYALAGLFAEGVGVVADDVQAARWYGAAARNGHIGAEVEYAIRLFNGKGLGRNEAQAARWFGEAARADNPVAQVRLARLLVEGRGIAEDPLEAARWYLIAQARGIKDATMDEWLARLDPATREKAAAAAQTWAGAHTPTENAAPAPATAEPVDKAVR